MMKDRPLTTITSNASEPSTLSTAEDTTSSWESQRQYWTNLYNHELLGNGLKRSIEFVQKNQNKAEVLQRHFASTLKLLQQTRHRPNLYPQLLELIELWQAWPRRWGYWETWEPHLQFAIELCREQNQVERQLKFWASYGEILLYSGRLKQCLVESRIAYALAKTHGQPETIALIGVIFWNVLHASEFKAESEAVLNELITLREQVSEEMRSTLDLLEAEALRAKGVYLTAIPLLNQVVARLEAVSNLTNPIFLAEAYRNRGVLLRVSNSYEQALVDLNRAKGIFLAEKDYFSQAVTLNDLGLIYWNMAELNLAEKNMREGIELMAGLKRSEEASGQFSLCAWFGNLGLIYLSRGELTAALEYIEQQLTMAEQIGFAAEVSRAIGNRGIALLHLGKYAVALSDLERDAAYTKKEARLEGLIVSYFNICRCLAGIGQKQKALELATESYSMAQETNAAGLVLLALRCLAEQVTDKAEQIVLLEQALQIARERNSQLDIAGCLLNLASLVDNPQQKRKLWEEGVAELTKIGATAWLIGCTIDNPPCIPLMT